MSQEGSERNLCSMLRRRTVATFSATVLADRRVCTGGKLLKMLAGTTGLEPATSCVTGMRSNQLNYVPRSRSEEYLDAFDGHARAKIRQTIIAKSRSSSLRYAEAEAWRATRRRSACRLRPSAMLHSTV
jgi:hypothetical protein